MSLTPLPIIRISVDTTASKWYGLRFFVPHGAHIPADVKLDIHRFGRRAQVQDTGTLYEAPFPDDEHIHGARGSPYVDHAPNPRHVMCWANRHGFHVETLSLEMMIGRWELECGAGRYDDVMEAAIP